VVVEAGCLGLARAPTARFILAIAGQAFLAAVGVA
jgi:hypothetical protein